MLLLATTHRQMKDFDMAAQFLEQSHKRLGDRADLVRETALLASDQEDWKAASAALLKLKKLDPEDVNTRLQLITLYEQTGEVEAAAREAREFARLRPEDKHAPLRAVHILIKGKKHKEAAKELETLVQSRRSDKQIRMMLVQLYSGPVKDPERRKIHERILEGLK